MKVLQVTPYYPPYLGGQEGFVQNLVSNLQGGGLDVTVATSDYPKLWAGSRGSFRRYRCLARPLRNPIAPGFVSLVKEVGDFDVIHTHNEHAFPSQVVALSKLVMDFPLVLTSHGSLRFGGGNGDFAVRAFDRFFASHFLRRADIVVCLSRSEATRFEELGVPEQRIRIIPNAIDPDYTASLTSGNGFRDRYALGDARVLLVVGPLIERKRPALAIRTFAALIRHHPDLRLLVIGDGPELAKCQQLAAALRCRDKVIFSGRVSKEDLYRAYRIASALILPSVSEGIPTTLLEAILHGTPSVVSDLPSIRDWFASYVTLVPANSFPQVVEAVDSVLANETTERARVMRARTILRDRFSWNSVVREYIGVYQEAS